MRAPSEVLQFTIAGTRPAILKEYDKDSIPAGILKKLEQFTKKPEYSPEQVGNQSKACRSLCLWTHAIWTYSVVAKEVLRRRRTHYSWSRMILIDRFARGGGLVCWILIRTFWSRSRILSCIWSQSMRQVQLASKQARQSEGQQAPRKVCLCGRRYRISILSRGRSQQLQQPN